LIGRMIDNFGFPVVFVSFSLLPMLAVGVLHLTAARGDSEAGPNTPAMPDRTHAPSR
jgi:hypothetical protein